MSATDVSRGPAFIFFRDWDFSHKRDRSGNDKFWYLTTDGRVVYPLRRRVRVVPYSRFLRKSHKTAQLQLDAYEKNVETFFIENARNANLSHLGVNAFASGELSFFDDPIKLPILEPRSQQDFEVRWSEFLGNVRSGDLIFTIDTESWISRLIAYGDCGTWSHVVSYIGEGRICEAITAGVVERRIDVYHHSRYRLGLYRWSTDAEKIAQAVVITRGQVGKRYNYRGGTSAEYSKAAQSSFGATAAARYIA